MIASYAYQYIEANYHETWDKRYTDIRIAECHPAIRKHIYALINYLDKEHGIKLRVTDWLRTFDEQNELYRSGRTKEGRILTYSKGGESWHNFGLAVDVVEIKDGLPLYKINKNWLLIGKTAEDFGFEWGGRWLSEAQKKLSENEQRAIKELGEGFDKPHIQMRFNLTLERANELYKIKKGKYILI
jgi:peptidoglycan L-alanyl-D-glutamate endopeptidase CwlK